MDILFFILFLFVAMYIYLYIYSCEKTQEKFCNQCKKNTCHKYEMGLYDTREFNGGLRLICRKCNSDNTD